MITKGDWEDFMAVGRVPRNLRREIRHSWQRSVSHPIEQLAMAPLLSSDELQLQRARARRLRASARAALERAGSTLAGTENIFLLSDRDGVVIDAAGDPATLERGLENHLHVGGGWAEDRIGTNAIGTALALGRPIEVRETEHFCEQIQRWSCAATPVLEPGTGRLLGVADISWPSGLERASAAALSGAFALQIESELARRLARDREILREQVQVRRLRRGNEPLLVLDRSGAVVFSTEDFERYCDDDGSMELLRARLPELIDQPEEAIAAALSEGLPALDLDVVSRRNEAVGLVVVPRRRPRRSGLAETALARLDAIGDANSTLAIQARRLAQVSIPVLIEGEDGTGKAELARYLHRAGATPNGPYQSIDCGRLSPDRLNDEAERGGFGLPHGTLCLVDPGRASAAAQELLLGLVEDAIQRGVRLVSVSPLSLYQQMQSGDFSTALYFRIAGARLQTRPLRERPDEIVGLLRQQARRHAEQAGGRELRFTHAALEALERYGWPGNLREMANLVAALDALSPNGLIDLSSLPAELHRPRPGGREQTLREVERTEIVAAIAAAGGNLSQAARSLGIARSTLYVKLESFGIARGPRR